MLKKILFGALTVLLALSLVGCGGKKDAAKTDAPAEQKAEVAVEGAPDKAILAYAQLYAYGVIEDENQAAAGLTDADIDKVQDQVLMPIVDAFKMRSRNDRQIRRKTSRCYGHESDRQEGRRGTPCR